MNPTKSNIPSSEKYSFYLYIAAIQLPPSINEQHFPSEPFPRQKWGQFAESDSELLEEQLMDYIQWV